MDFDEAEMKTRNITRIEKVKILIGLLDATLDHEQFKDTPFQAPEWLVKHYPQADPDDLDEVLAAGRAALARINRM